MTEDTGLPAGWARTTLGDITRRGEYGTSVKCDYQSKGTPVMRIPNIAGGLISLDDVKYATEDVGYGTDDYLQPGDLLVCRTNGSISLIGKAALVRNAFDQSTAFASYLLRFRLLEPTALPRWVYWYFQSWQARSFIEANAASSAGQHNVSMSLLRGMPVPIPPLPEQERVIGRIEELLSDLDAGVAALKRARANLKKYRAAVLKAAVTGELTADWRATHPNVEPASEVLKRIESPPRPARYKSRSKDIIPGHAALSVGATGAPLPSGWVWCPLVDVAKMESGHTPSRNHPEWWEGDVPWIGILDAKASHGGTITETLQKTNEQGLANSAARLLPVGTVCISRTAASIGYVTVLGKPMATSQDFVNWVPTEAVRSDWLRVIFMVDREVLIRFGKGSTHKTVYFPEWLSLHVAVPPLAEQEAIATEVERQLSIIAATGNYIDASLKRAARLRQSILKEAFAGRLVPQDPADEPASVLLDRIRQSRNIENGAAPARPRGRKKTNSPTPPE